MTARPWILLGTSGGATRHQIDTVTWSLMRHELPSFQALSERQHGTDRTF
jgi:hypothetical protein